MTSGSFARCKAAAPACRKSLVSAGLFRIYMVKGGLQFPFSSAAQVAGTVSAAVLFGRVTV
jgi:hypothetical protein